LRRPAPDLRNNTTVTVLAGDIGGTNSRLALYDGRKVLFERTYPSAQQASLEAAGVQFLADARRALGASVAPQRACLAVAGPIEGRTARVTNLSWFVDAASLEKQLGIAHVRLANDFEAAAFGVTLLEAEHLVNIGGGPRQPRGPMVVAGPGTGLGQAFLFWSETDAAYRVVPSEAGHGDFAPRTAMEFGLATQLSERYGRVSYERVISGPAFKDLFAYLLAEPACRALVTDETRTAILAEDPAAVIVRQAVAGRDQLCVLAVNMFASALGAFAGNLALSVLATGGVFIAGGIAPRILDILRGGVLREAFEAKGRFQPFLSKIPLYVVTSKEVGLLGAAALAG
jgi:glucokinase